MAYEMFLPDTSTRNKMLGIADQYVNIPGSMAQYRQLGQNALNQYMGSAMQNIGAQFTPTMRMASARLAGNPLLANSGYANRLNRQIQTAAFGDLSRAYGSAAAQQSQSELEALRNLMQQRYGLLSGMYGSAQKKQGGGVGGAVGGLLGAGAGALLGNPGFGAAAGKWVFGG